MIYDQYREARSSSPLPIARGSEVMHLLMPQSLILTLFFTLNSQAPLLSPSQVKDARRKHVVYLQSLTVCT